MKRIVSLFLALILVCMAAACAAESIDLSGLSFDELMSLRQALDAEIMSRPEWKEVAVPAGTWVVGKDIPAGSYCIKSEKGYVNVTVWRKVKDDYSNNGLVYNELIKPESPLGKIELEDGFILDLGRPVVFTPPMSLGF